MLDQSTDSDLSSRSYLANQWNLQEPGQISVFSSKTLKPLVEKRLLV